LLFLVGRRIIKSSGIRFRYSIRLGIRWLWPVQRLWCNQSDASAWTRSAASARINAVNMIVRASAARYIAVAFDLSSTADIASSYRPSLLYRSSGQTRRGLILHDGRLPKPTTSLVDVRPPTG
jgi:hypothetical protein